MTVPKLWRNIPHFYNLKGSKCAKCNKLHFPKREVCMKCNSTEYVDYKFKGKGKIVTFTIIRTPVSDPEHEITEIAARNLPYAIAIIELEEGPMITSEIVDCDLNEVAIGKNVQVVFRKLVEKGRKGVIQYGYKFRITQ